MVHQLNTVVVVVYRPPDTRISEFSDMLEQLDSCLSSLPAPIPSISIMGDFNFPRNSLVWTRLEDESNSDLVPIVAGHREGETAGGKQDRLQAAKLCDFATKHSLVQHVDQPTHGIEVLDLIFTNNPNLVSSVTVESWPAFTDHKVLTATTSFLLGPQPEKEEVHLLECGRRLKRLNFNRAEWIEIQAELSEFDWSDLESAAEESPTLALSLFLDEILPVLERHVPSKKRSNRKIKNKTDRRRKLMWRRIAKVKEKLKVASSIQRITQLLSVKSDLEQELFDDYLASNRQEEDNAIFSMKSNPKAFFAFSKSRQKIKAKIGPFIDQRTGKPNPDPDFAAAELARQYSSVFVQPRPEWVVNNVKEFFKHSDEESNQVLTDIKFTEEDIEAACAELNSSSAPGADGIPTSFLKTCRRELRRPLYILWRASLDQGLIPEDLLLVLISPVHKGGSRGIPKNYRPVALTSHIVKVFERVVRRALVKHLEDNDLLPSGQHGFRAFRSTLTQLLSYWDTILEELEQGNGVDVIYTDFSKAFDKVETGVLIHKLRDCGISGKVGTWIAAFLDSTARQQAVVVDGRVSSLTPVVSGVPQGTVLGPILFLVHIRDIANSLSDGTSATSFADDTRVKRGINSLEDCDILQADLQTIYDWARHVNMHFNSDKFECMRLWPRQSTTPDFKYLGPDGNTIEVKESLKDLGVHISSDLSFKLQVEKTVGSASKLAGWGLRTFRRRSLQTLKGIWKSLVQPKLDYCSQFWSPGDQESINRIESVQRHFFSQVSCRLADSLNYWEKLELFKLASQERRRDRYMIIFIWKISQGLVHGYSLEFTSIQGRRGRSCIPRSVVHSSPGLVRRARENSLGSKGARMFNLLPGHIRNIDSDKVEVFKTALDDFLSRVPDQPTTAGLGRAAESNSLLHQIPLYLLNC